MKRMQIVSGLSALLALGALVGCGDDDRPPTTDSGTRTDSGTGSDSGTTDSGMMGDSGGTDSGMMTDAGMEDGGGDLCVGVDCTALDDACNAGVCNDATGACEAQPVADGTSCDDSDICTDADACTAGVCGGTGADCTALDDACNAGVCDPSTGACAAMPMADGTACDDGDGCTMADACTAGVCGGGAVDCSALTDACNVGMCDATTGACVAIPMADGTTCDDGDLCSTTDICTTGACGGTAVDCSGMTDMCNAGSCDPTTGACTATPVADGTSCDDADVCTMADVCTTGTCGGAAATPAGDTCASPLALLGTFGLQTVTGSTSCGAADEGGSCGGAGANDIVYALTLPGPRRVRFETTGAYDTLLHVRSTCGSAASEIACNDDGGAGTLSLINADLNAGTYFLFVDGFGSGSGDYTVEVEISAYTSCYDLHTADPSLPSGTYPIQPDPAGMVRDVYCDMTTDGGGWTLVGSTLGQTMNDEASAYYADLATIRPAAAHTGIWDEMRSVVTGNSDIRFSCRASPGAVNYTVDLSFYDNDWYREITTGTDAMSAFQETNGGAGYDRPAPARRNNLNNLVRSVGDDWNFGYLEGEDSAGDTSDFTVDFDDRGMDSNQSDGTDWGEDDGSRKCGTTGLTNGNWFIWVRENIEAPGHAVLIGHDLFSRNADIDRVVGNSVFMANNRGATIRVLQYTQWSDNGGTGEAANTRAAINARAAALGRAVTFTTLSDHLLLSRSLVGQDVLLVPEQERGTSQMAAVATAWNSTLRTFLDNGGTIVVCDYSGGAWRVLNGAGLMNIPTVTNSTGATITRTAANANESPSVGVAASYTGLSGTNRYPGSTRGRVLFENAGSAVVRHLVR